MAALEVIPEGLEDIQIIGDVSVFVQAKSRQASQGEFSVEDVLGFLRKMIETRARQSRDSGQERIVLVVERAIKGAQSVGWDESLANLPATDPLRLGAEALFISEAASGEEAAILLARSAVVVLSWGQLDTDTLAGLSAASGLPMGGAEPLLHTLRETVSRVTATNAARDIEARVTLSRQAIQRLVVETAQLIDIGSLTAILSNGRCSPVDFETPIDDPRFYEGIDVRPGHVVAGLPAPRPAFVEFACDAVREHHVALLAGPSGVGKSTMMWSTAYAMRDVLWYELMQLEHGDESDVWRLLKALRPTPTSPVGLIVDSIGTKDPAAWDSLRNRLPVDGSVLLLGSIRTEDLSTLATAGNAAIIECRLDVTVARELFDGLHAQGRAVLPVWEDAYNACNDLTMEYTYLLTKGERLSAVLREQVLSRERQHRSIEIDVLRLVATASRWGARVPSGALNEFAPDAGPRNEAMRRLVGEHLIVLNGTHYGGLHQLRASVVSSIIHETPPPDLLTTIVQLIGVVDPADLRALIVGCLFERPELAPRVIEALVERSRSAELSVVTLILRALRTADFRRDSLAWATVLDANHVPQAYRPVSVWLALADSHVEIDDSLWKPGIGASVREMKSSPQNPLWRDRFLQLLGLEEMTSAVTKDALELADLEDLLGSLQGATRASEIATAVAGMDRTAELVGCTPPEEATRFMGVVGGLAPNAATGLRDALGSDPWAQSVLLALNPWLIRSVRSSSDGDASTISGDLLCGGDWFAIDLHEQAVGAARTMLSLYPESTVDVRTINALGNPVTFQGYEPGRSQLLRRYNQHTLAIIWNRERAELALEFSMRRADAERAHVVPSLVVDVAHFLADLTSSWARGVVSRAGAAARLEESRQCLTTINDALPAYSHRSRSGPTDDDGLSVASVNVLGDDVLHTLVDGICANLPGRLLIGDNYNSLAAYVGDTLLNLVPKVEQAESWYEDPDDSARAALHSIEIDLRDLHHVLADIAYGHESTPVVLASATAGASDSALSRCAERARQRAASRLGVKLDQIAFEAASSGVRVRWVTRNAPTPKATDWPPVEVAFLVDLDSLDDWEAAVAIVSGRLGNEGEYSGIGLPLILPTIGRRSVLTLAMRRGSVLFPAADEARAWGSALGVVAETPALDALQRLWICLQALSSLTLRARLRNEAHALDDMPSGLVAEAKAAATEVSSRLEGFPLQTVWETWREETMGTVVAQATRPDVAAEEVWVRSVTQNESTVPEALVWYSNVAAAILRHDVEFGHLEEAGPRTD